MADNAADLARAEREDLAAFLETLTPQQWEAQSLCDRWRVRDVVAHMISYDRMATPVLIRRFVEARLDFNKVNEFCLTEMAAYTPEQLLAEFRRHLVPRGLTRRFGGLVALVDGMIHQQDIRRPLGAQREIPRSRLERALPFARIAPPIRALQRVRGLRLIATDVGWVHGRGPVVRGPGEALLLAMAGRAVALPELEGDGLPVLAGRMPELA